MGAGAIAANLPRDMDMSSHNEPSHSTDDHTEKSHAMEHMSSTSAVPHVMKHQHGVPIIETDLLPQERLFWDNYNTTNYFNYPGANHRAIWTHTILIWLTALFIYPIALVFKNLKYWKCYTVGLAIHTLVVLVSLGNYLSFMLSIPDLYPNNAYNKMLWILLFSTLTQLVTYAVSMIKRDTQYERLNLAYSRGPSEESLESESDEMKNYEPREGLLGKFQLMMQKVCVVGGTVHSVATIVFNLLNWAHFFYFFVYLPTGIATFLLLGKGITVFNLLAHFIKGGVFFAYGILSLARYCGVLQNKGWAWNHRFITTAKANSGSRWERMQSKGLCTMEMVESGLILFYGSTNIFMEHMSNQGGEWSAKDLQHVLIAFIFIGCGLCGVITEMKLNDWRYEKASMNAKQHGDEEPLEKATPGFSPNPFPLLTIFWTGILMSKHQQASEILSEIHIQWGNMFMLGCFFRMVTYTMLILTLQSYLSRKQMIEPSRPMSELIVSFCLICGGLIFMESCDPVVLLFEWYGFTSMFTLNVSLGLVTLLMGWEMLVFALKDVLKRRAQKTEEVREF